MIDNLLGDDDDDETADESDDEEMGGLFDDPGDDGMDGGTDGGMDGGGDDDLMGGDDDLMGDDEMSFDDGGDGGATNSEMNNRIDELENEVASLSSSVNTVKSENEQISEALDDVEENIRKLLEVYEMVTRGVNPFVNENELGDAFGGGADGGGGDGGSMGLFGGDEAQEESSEIDESVANADADDFFDDDLDDDFDEGDDFEDGDFDDGEDLEEDDGEDPEDDDGFEESFDDGDEFGEDDGFDDGADADDGGDSGGGKSFEELKSEYESGDAEWEEGGGDDEEGATDADDDTDLDDPRGDEGGLDGSDDDAAVAPDDGTDLDSLVDDDAATDAGDGAVDEQGDPGAVADGKPYLQQLPAGYTADVVVMDWLEFLVDEAGVDGAARTIAYYEAIDWVSASAAERLQTYLRGFGDDVEADPEPRSWLTVSHHETSLRFISRIDDPSMEMVAFDEWGGQPFRGESQGGDPPGTPRAAPDAGTRDAYSSSRPDYELESDGGRRTQVAGDGARYEPAVSRRRRDGHRSGNDDDAADEVGYGGFVWNDGGR